jgi:hypothetical protein
MRFDEKLRLGSAARSGRRHRGRAALHIACTRNHNFGRCGTQLPTAPFELRFLFTGGGFARLASRQGRVAGGRLASVRPLK